MGGGAGAAVAAKVTYFERDFEFASHAAEVEATWDPNVGGGPTPAPAVCVSRTRIVGTAAEAAAPDAPATARTAAAAAPSSSSSVAAAAAARSYAAASPSSLTAAVHDCAAAAADEEKEDEEEEDEKGKGAVGNSAGQAKQWDAFHRQHRGRASASSFPSPPYLLPTSSSPPPHLLPISSLALAHQFPDKLNFCPLSSCNHRPLSQLDTRTHSAICHGDWSVRQGQDAASVSGSTGPPRAIRRRTSGQARE
jgi:hypothetical protein